MSAINKPLVQEPVEAGAVSDAVAGFFGKMFNAMFTDTENKTGVKIQKTSPMKNNAEIWKVTTSDEKYTFKMRVTVLVEETRGETDDDFSNSEVDPKKEQTYNLHFKGKDPEGQSWEEKIDNVVGLKKVQEAILNVAKTHYGIDAVSSVSHGDTEMLDDPRLKPEGDGEVKESKRLRATFKRVVASDGDEIHLVKVNASYDPTEALSDITALMQSDEFIAGIGEDPVTYDISAEGDDLAVTDVPACDESATCNDMCDMYHSIIVAASQLFFNLSYAETCCNREGMYEIQKFASCNRYCASDMMRSFNDLCQEQCNTSFNPISIAQECTAITDSDFGNAQAVRNAIIDMVHTCINVLELNYCNVPHDIQRIFDEYIRCWKRCLYFELHEGQSPEGEGYNMPFTVEEASPIAPPTM